MEKNELVRRVKDPHDRRVVRIHLLEKGRVLIGEVIRKRQAYLQGVLSHFSPDELVKLKSNLLQLHQEMKTE